MRFILILIPIFLFANYRLTAQVQIAGTVIDSVEKRPMANAIVSVISLKDSMLLRFTRTDNNGKFSMPGFDKTELPKIFFVISYPGFADFAVSGRSDSISQLLKQVYLFSKVHLLQEVIVKQGVKAIRINNDTIEYKADSFRVHLNATVEDLLKKFPGFQIDIDGKIIANGQRVERVLVDGEEYFGSDPTLVTRNFRADLIDKVQLFDKKSDQAAFTGIDDGKKIRTLNLKIKEDRQNTFFGKVSEAVSNDGYNNSELMANKFNKKERLAVFGIASNTGKQGLTWQDEDKFGDGDLSGNAGYKNTDLLDTWSGTYDGRGFPNVYAGGLHYNNKWGNQPQAISSNYRIMDLGVNGTNEITRNDILPNSVLTNYQRQNYSNNIVRNSFNGAFDSQLDSFLSLKVTLDAAATRKHTVNLFTSSINDSQGGVLSEGTRNVSFNGANQFFAGNILLRRKFRKKGRTFSLNVNSIFTDNTSDGNLKAINHYYQNSTVLENIDQLKTNANNTVGFTSKVTYSEPLSTKAVLSFNAGISKAHNISERKSYNIGTDGKYTSLDSLYSNSYMFDIVTYKSGINYSIRTKKINVSVGNDLGFTSFEQQERTFFQVFNRHFTNLYPQAVIGIPISSNKSLTVSYNGSTLQPSLSQIQPLRSNTDPLNVAIGNPLLDQSFSHNIELTYVNSRSVKRQSFWINATYNIIANGISTSDIFDSSGKRTYQYINVHGIHVLNSYAQYSFVEKKIKAALAFSITYNDFSNVNYINTQKVISNSSAIILGSSVQKSIDNKFDFTLRYSGAYWTSNSSFQRSLPIHYWIHNIRPSVDVYLPLKTQFHTDVQLYLIQQTSVFNSNSNFYLVNAYYAKKFLKTEALVLKLSVNDLLNSNKGITRVVNTTYATQNVSNTIQRYFMLTLSWDFVKAPPKAK